MGGDFDDPRPQHLGFVDDFWVDFDVHGFQIEGLNKFSIIGLDQTGQGVDSPRGHEGQKPIGDSTHDFSQEGNIRNFPAGHVGGGDDNLDLRLSNFIQKSFYMVGGVAQVNVDGYDEVAAALVKSGPEGLAQTKIHQVMINRNIFLTPSKFIRECPSPVCASVVDDDHLPPVFPTQCCHVIMECAQVFGKDGFFVEGRYHDRD